MESDNNKLGVINEIGDLGLGFEPLSDEDIEKLKQEEQEDKK